MVTQIPSPYSSKAGIDDQRNRLDALINKVRYLERAARAGGLGGAGSSGSPSSGLTQIVDDTTAFYLNLLSDSTPNFGADRNLTFDLANANRTLQLKDDLSTLDVLSHATQPLNSKGNSFTTIQGALNDLAGDGWVYVPTGTWNETVTLNDENTVLFGAGKSSIINGGTSGHAITVSARYNVIRNLAAQTTAGGGNPFDSIHITIGQEDNWVLYCWVLESDRHGIYHGGEDCMSMGNTILFSDEDGIHQYGTEGRILSNSISTTGGHGIHVRSTGDQSLLANNMIEIIGDDGIYIHADGNLCNVANNNITNWTNEAIDDDSGTSIIFNNLNSDSMIPSNFKIQFRDPQIYMASLTDGYWDIVADLGINLIAPSIFMSVYGSDYGMVLCLDFEEGAGAIVYDRSPYGNDGTLTDTAWVDGKFGKCLSYNNASSIIDFTYHATLAPQTFTIEAWIYLDTNNNWNMIFDNRDGNADGVYFGVDSNGKLKSRVNGAANPVSADTLSTATWYHVVSTYDQTDHKIYLNGVEVDSNNIGALVIDVSANPQIGTDWGETLWFDGLIDQFRMYNRALSANEIRTHYLNAQGMYSRSVTVSDNFRILGTDLLTNFSLIDGVFMLGDGTNYTSILADGEINLLGTAQVMRTADIDLHLFKLTPINPDAGDEDGFFTLDFADNRDEGLKYMWHLSHDYADAGTIHFHVHFFVDAVPAGADETVEWTLEYKKLSDGDVFDFDAGTTTTTQTQVITNADTPKEIYEMTTISLVTAGFTPNDHLLIYIHRDGGAGNDDFTGDARLINVHVEYLSDRLGEAT